MHASSQSKYKTTSKQLMHLLMYNSNYTLRVLINHTPNCSLLLKSTTKRSFHPYLHLHFICKIPQSKIFGLLAILYPKSLKLKFSKVDSEKIPVKICLDEGSDSLPICLDQIDLAKSIWSIGLSWRNPYTAKNENWFAHHDIVLLEC